MDLRKMSLLSSLSVTIPLDQDYNVRAVSPGGCPLSPEHILPISGKLFYVDNINFLNESPTTESFIYFQTLPVIS